MAVYIEYYVFYLLASETAPISSFFEFKDRSTDLSKLDFLNGNSGQSLVVHFSISKRCSAQHHKQYSLIALFRAFASCFPFPDL